MSFTIEGVNRTRFFSLDKNDGEFYAWIPYSDSVGSQIVHARVHATRKKSGDQWAFHRVDYFNPDETERRASLEFDARITAAGA